MTAEAGSQVDVVDVVFRADRVVTTQGTVPADVGVRAGMIVSVSAYGEGPAAGRVVELAGDEVLLPGLVDSHVHVDEPGRTSWEGYASATRAAAAGGVTTIIDMPLNCIPPTVDPAALHVKREAAQGQCYVDVGFWGGAVPGNLAELRPLQDAGVFGFKCFLLDSGVEEFPPLDPDELTAAVTEVAGFDGLVIVHAEDPEVVGSAPAAAGSAYDAFLRSRPAEAEVVAIRAVVEAARRAGARVHVLHLSSAAALPVIAAARADGVRVTAETCPHYLALVAEEVPAGATAFKCCPPIRERANQDLLWQGLAGGVIDCVVSDHSPATPELKLPADGDFGTAWGGISSLQLGLPVVWTAARARGVPLARVVGWLAAGPARVAGLTRKGAIAVGRDADLVVFAPDETFVVDPGRLYHKVPVTPYAGRPLSGVVRRTFLRGVELSGSPPSGRLLTRGDA